MNVGDLVIYIPSPSSLFKWKSWAKSFITVGPGVIIEEIEEKGTTTRRFKIRWHNGNITEEWITYLEVYGKGKEPENRGSGKDQAG